RGFSLHGGSRQQFTWRYPNMASHLKNPPERPMPNLEEYAEKHTEEHIASPEEMVIARGEPPHNASLTAVAAEALATGLYPMEKEEEVPGEDDRLRAGDPDAWALENLYVGEEMPGGSTPLPDQNNVDEAARLAGNDAGSADALRSTEEILERRDQHRWA